MGVFVNAGVRTRRESRGDSSAPLWVMNHATVVRDLIVHRNAQGLVFPSLCVRGCSGRTATLQRDTGCSGRDEHEGPPKAVHGQP